MNSLRKRLILLFVVVTTTTLGLFGYYEQKQLREDLERRFSATRQDIVEHLRHSLTDPVWSLNQETMNARLEAALLHPEVARVQILAPDGQEVYAAIARPIPLDEKLATPDETLIYPPAEVSAERRVLPTARLRIDFDRSEMDDSLRRALNRQLAEVVAMNLLLLLLLCFGLRLMFDPLAQLRDALNDLAGRDADTLEELPPFRLREFDSVIDGFNRTLRRLRLIILHQGEAETRARAAMRSTNEALAQVRAAQQELLEKNRQLEILSITDRLTGLYNRHKLDALLQSELARCQRYGGVFSLILLDVDHFKAVNDRFGHPVGDCVLRDIARKLEENKRGADTLGRWGGEEFMLISPDTALDGALQFAEKLREAVEKHCDPTAGGVTASFGVASFRDGDSLKDLVARADQALYRSKHMGRNRVECLD